MSTLIVNLYGAPGAGKSTGAAYVFSMLKMRGVNAELVTEFAKDKTWEGSLDALKNQAYVFGEQYERISRLIGKVDVIVTDSPILLSIVYNQINQEESFDKNVPQESFKQYVLGIHSQYDNLNYYINRTKKYIPTGRNQNESEASEIGDEIIQMLGTHNVKYSVMTGCITDYNNIVEDIINHLKPGVVQHCSKCGKELDIWDTQEDFSIKRDLGYGTKYDGDKLDIHLCCDCMEKLIDECKISPIIDNT